MCFAPTSYTARLVRSCETTSLDSLHHEHVDDDPAPILTSGNVLAGIYRIRELIGGGAMGQVYEAEDVVLKSRVAIKIALPIAVAAGASLRA